MTQQSLLPDPPAAPARPERSPAEELTDYLEQKRRKDPAGAQAFLDTEMAHNPDPAVRSALLALDQEWNCGFG